MPHIIDFLDAAILMLPVVLAAIGAPMLFLRIVR